MYVDTVLTRDASVREFSSSRMAAGDASVSAPGLLCAGGLAPAKMPFADSLSVMYFITESEILAMTPAPLLLGRNCVRIITYVFQSTDTYVLVPY